MKLFAMFKGRGLRKSRQPPLAMPIIAVQQESCIIHTLGTVVAYRQITEPYKTMLGNEVRTWRAERIWFA